MRTFGTRLQAARKDAGLTQLDLGNRMNPPVSRNAVSRWESDTDMPEPDKLVDIAKAVRKTIDYLLTGARSGPNIEAGPELHGQVPLISWVQAGTWQSASDPFQPGDAEDWLDSPKKNGKNTYALRVRGDSMTATHGKSYPEGCIIFVDPDQRSPINGSRVIAKLDGSDEVTFKVFMQEAGRTWLRALNHQHPPIFDPFKVLGTVIGKWEPE